MLLRPLMILGLMLAIGGCTPSTVSAFEKTCAAMQTGYTVFSTLKESGRFPAKTIAYVDASYAGANALCLHPPKDAASAAVQVAAALVIVAKAIDRI